MALDYIIGGLQLLSAAVNVLALGAFWVSPGLRATANRFVINLLVANIIASLALTPALWLHGGLKTRFQMDTNVSSSTVETIYLTPNLKFETDIRKIHTDKTVDTNDVDESTVNRLHHHHQHHQHRNHHRGDRFERDVEQPEYIDSDTSATINRNNIQESIEAVVIERLDRGNVRKFTEKRLVDIRNDDKNDEIEIFEEIAAEPSAVVSERSLDAESIAIIKQRSTTANHRAYTVYSENALIFDCTRFWGFDFAAAVGVLSVMLVVGDTWCAVTDPLRYHSRISYLKSWLLIASVWIVSITVTFISAFRSKWCNIELETNESITEEEQLNASAQTTTATLTGSSETMFMANIYALVFSCVFFAFIVLMPIAVVCIMYYHIFSEARQSGLRMRRNGSSPLLQSSLNLNNSGMNTVALNENQRYPSIFDVSAADAITMKIDSQQYDAEDGKINTDYSKKTPIATHQYRRYLDIPDSEKQPSEQALCKRQRTKSERSLTGLKPKLSQFRRHFSARHLVALEKSCDVPAFLTKNHSLSRIISGDIRQVHSSPNLQKLSNFDLLHKVPFCVNNNRSSTSIQQTGQQSSNAPRALSYMVSIRHRLSNASSIFKYREESRAARIGTVVVAMLMLSYLPYGLLILLQGRLTFISNASLFSILFLLIANISSPFIFAYRNRRVRRGVCRLFGVDPKPNNYLQKQRQQLRNGQTTNNGNKHVRIHRNLSASNFSLNMLPYKFATHSMLQIQNGDQMPAANAQSRHGSVLVPIDDVETESNDAISGENTPNTDAMAKKTMDANNNRLMQTNASDAVKVSKEKMSLFQRICSNGSRKATTISSDSDEKQCNNQCETKDDAI